MERFFLNSPWTCFAHGTVEYDPFDSFDTRITSDLGIGHKLIDTDATFFIVRTGAGVSREIGGSDNSFTPEAVLGADFEHRFGKRYRLVAAVEYIPAFTDFGQYRVNSHAAWQFSDRRRDSI